MERIVLSIPIRTELDAEHWQERGPLMGILAGSWRPVATTLENADI